MMSYVCIPTKARRYAMLANLKFGSALAVSVCILAGSMTGSASAVTSEVAKKCEALTAKAYPPREPGNPAAGGANGKGPAERRYFSKCVANRGNMPAEPSGAPLQAAGEDGVRIGELVQFPSGGPTMTVISIQGDNVTCQWTTDAGQVVSGTFPIIALTARRNSGGLNDRKEVHYTYKPCPASVAIRGRDLCL